MKDNLVELGHKVWRLVSPYMSVKTQKRVGGFAKKYLLRTPTVVWEDGKLEDERSIHAIVNSTDVTTSGADQPISRLGPKDQTNLSAGNPVEQFAKIAALTGEAPSDTSSGSETALRQIDSIESLPDNGIAAPTNSEMLGDFFTADKHKEWTEQRVNDGMRDYPVTRPKLAFDFLSGLVRYAADSDYSVMSYNDLAGPFKHGQENAEFSRWIDRAKQRSEKALLFQYDVDARPDITEALMKTHIEVGVPGNAMVFQEKIFDWKLKREGILEVDDSYKHDFRTFEEFQKIGGVIGYHCNAYDRSGDNMERAIELFHEDVAELRKHVDLKFFSMHGGHVTKEGKCNARIDIEPYIKSLGLTWVHNGHSVYFHANWADGSASNPLYRNESNDPLDFILATKEGERTRFLFHPQYYNDLENKSFDFPILQDQKWVRQTRDAVESDAFSGKKYWNIRVESAKSDISAYDKLFEFPQEPEKPIFINGMSRSGTTLLVSMFDAHAKGAMAYESYPRYLNTPSGGGVLTVEEYIYAYQTLSNYPDQRAFQLLNRDPLKNLMRFAAVTNWTGMNTQQIGELLRAYLVKNHRVPDETEALKIVAASARYKVLAQGAEFWGTKCQGNFNSYFDLWPQAKMIYIMRNGLDILASQKTTGSFNPDATKLGKNWRDKYTNYMKFKEKHPEFVMALVNYEELVGAPEDTCRALCEQIALEYQPQMIRQHEVESTLVRNPRGQLSAERVQQPIDVSSVNKWRKILNKSDVDAFLEGCGGPGLFEEFNYDWKF